VFGAGALLFLLANAGFAFTGASLAALAIFFVLAGVARGFVETDRDSAVLARNDEGGRAGRLRSDEGREPG